MSEHKGLSPDTLKCIALAAMFIDHVSYGIIRKIMLNTTNLAACSRLENIAQLMNWIGRIAFPIFAYQLVQGFIFTRNRSRYVRNLLIFSALSEVPFDLYFYSTLPYLRHQNVILELMFGLVMLGIFEYVNHRFFGIDFLRDDLTLTNNNTVIYPDAGEQEESTVTKSTIIKALVVDIIIATVFLIAAQELHFDYGGKGIILIASIYLLYRNRDAMLIICPMLFILSFYPVNLILNHASHDIAINSVISEVPACFAFLLINYDNGVRKIKGRRKYLFYAFYPAHLLFLLVIRNFFAMFGMVKIP